MKAMSTEEFNVLGCRVWLRTRGWDASADRIALALEQREALLETMKKIAYSALYGVPLGESKKLAQEAVAHCES